MTHEQTQRVLEILVGIAGTDEVLNERDVDLFEAGLIDSLGFVELLVSLESAVGLEVTPTEVDRDEIATVNRLLSFVEERI